MSTIASLIVDVAANTVQLQKDVTQISSQLDRFTGMATKVAGAFGLAFSAQAVISFGKELLDTADALTKMHDKTGITVEGLQRLQVAGDDAGNTLDEITAGINMMQKRMAGGDASAVSALNELNLHLEDLRTLAPDRQFMAMADAIAQVKDPAEQVKLAVELFGKSGANLLPLIKRGFDDVRDSAPGMSGATVKALDDIGDAFGRMWRTTKGGVGEAVGQLLDLRSGGLLSQQFAAAQALEQASSHRPNLVKADEVAAVKTGADALKLLNQELAIEKDRQHDAAEATRKATEQHQHFLDSVTDMTTHMNLSVFTLNKYGAVALPMVQSSIEGVDRTIDHLDSTTLVDLDTRLQHVGATASTTISHASAVTTTWRDDIVDLAHAFSMLGNIGMGSLGNIVQGIGTMINAVNVADKGISALKNGFHALTDGSVLKGIGGIVSGIGGIVGAASAAINGIKGIFSALAGGEEHSYVNPMRDAFMAEHGGLSGLNQSVFEATGNIDLVKLLLAADNKVKYDAASGAIERVLAGGGFGGGSSSFNLPSFDPSNSAPFSQDFPLYGMADGGMGRTNGPTWFYSGGNEDFAFGGEGRSFGGVNLSVVVNVQGNVTTERELIAAVRDGINDDWRMRNKGRAA